MGQAHPSISAAMKDYRELLKLIYYCQNGRDGLVHGALKLPALHLSQVDSFENYIFEISRQNCVSPLNFI